MNCLTLFLRRNVLSSLMIVTCAVLGFGITPNAFAADGSGDDIVKRLEKLESETGENSLWNKLRLNLYGYVEASYTQNFNNPTPQANNLRIFNTDSNSFRANMAQIVLDREGKGDGSWMDRAGFRIKMDMGEDAQFTGGRGADDFDVQEGYVQFIAPLGNGLDLKFGRMNTLVGFEVIESPYNPNHSRSWLFGLGQPFTTLGFRGGYDVNEMLSLSVGVVNSFSRSVGSDDNNSKSVEWLATITPHDMVGINLYGIYGRELALGTGLKGYPTVFGDRTLVGGYVTIEPFDKTTFIVEGYYANQAPDSGSSRPSGNQRWNGVAAYGLYDFTNKLGLRVRGEIWEDAGGMITCSGTGSTATAPGAGNANVCFPGFPVGTPAVPTPQTLWETTWTLEFKPVPAMMTRLEYRYDKSNKNLFQDGASGFTNNQSTLSASAIFLF